MEENLLSLLVGIAVGFFYDKYVPLVKSFQIALIPVLFAVFLTTIINRTGGTLLFIFAFPLINNLPYFFGIAEPIPITPTALVLGLIYLWARLIGSLIIAPKLPRYHPIFGPMSLFVVLVIVSALVTFLRYANFYPIGSDRIYELTTNIHRVTSGGAIRSALFTALSDLTAIGVFLALITSLNSSVLVRQPIGILALSTGLPLLFGAYQHFWNPSLGNNSISIDLGLIKELLGAQEGSEATEHPKIFKAKTSREWKEGDFWRAEERLKSACENSCEREEIIKILNDIVPIYRPDFRNGPILY
jgi:hypothetical protein